MFDNIEVKGNYMSFDINDVDVSIVNALRRVIISEVPCVAFSFDPTVKDNDIVIHTNTGALHNEFLGHRISLIPLHFTIDEIDNFEPDNYQFVIKVKNDTTGMKEVTTNDFEVYDETGGKYSKEFCQRILPPNEVTKDYILITKLKPNHYDNSKGDEISLTAKASVNIGKVHSRWCPVSICTYHNNVDKEEAEKELRKYVQEHTMTGLSEEELRARFNTLQVFRSFKKNEYLEPNSFHFQVESVCNLSPSYIVDKGMQVLIDKLKNLKDNVYNDERVQIEQMNGMSYITVSGEDHTLGNLIQSMFYNMFVRKGEGKSVSYVGYYKPHPLEDHVIIKMRCEEKEVPLKIFEYGLARITDTIITLKSEWSSFKK
jgi:DNA-directed RNA polymerase subunit L